MVDSLLGGLKKAICSDYHYCSQDELSIPYRDIKLIEKRLADFKKNGEKGIPWEEVEKELYELLEKESR